MKLKAQLSGTEYDVSLNLDDNFATVDIDGRRYDLEVRERASGEYVLLNGVKVHRCRVQRRHDSQPTDDSFEVVMGGESYEVLIVDPKRLRSGQSSAAHHAGAVEIVSPMPGKIVRVLAEVGASVDAGAGVIVVEAMKMQNEMKAPKAGVIVSINAKEGDTVNAGDVLAVIE
jgi:biotin carboxyl carrier protein